LEIRVFMLAFSNAKSSADADVEDKSLLTETMMLF
jgi:hypothetical protein